MPGTRSAPVPLDLDIASSVADRVYEVLRARIVSGEMERGSRMHQEDLAAELGVSRTPVREALRRLAAEGLVELRSQRGARVADANPEDLRAAYQARLVVEPGAARLAAQQGLGPPQRRMRDAIVAHRRAGANVVRSFAANRDFHVALVEASGNLFLHQFVERLWVARLGAVIYELQAEPRERVLADADEHEAIADAVAAGDGRRAETLTRRHIAAGLERFARA